MLPRITLPANFKENYQAFLNALSKTPFAGEIQTSYAARLTAATDNSIYQVIPEAILFPKHTQDVSLILTCANQEEFRTIQFCARGGGTGTNGQSLTQGIVIDCSKFMTAILEIDEQLNWVHVQPGIVLDQLNAYLKKVGKCFAPEISPSNRATLGGMINTDACGMGSRVVGRTSDHVVDLTCVLATGAVIKTTELNLQDSFQQTILKSIADNQELIEKKFTLAPRTLNGYNLKKLKQHANYLFCGSEGTLGIVTECKLKITPLPKYKKLILIKYHCFDDALRSIPLTEKGMPFAIEAIDEKLIALAREDSSYIYIKDFIGDAKAVNLVEFVADNEQELEEMLTAFCARLKNTLGYYITKDTNDAKLLWDLRKKSVGLISKKQDGTRRPIPFIEDTAVPPEKLADYIFEFKTLLNQYNLMYGMYGHVDAGCVHVRPALDMKNSNDEKLIQELSNKVALLVEKYQGVMWGEHGQGYRCEYGERFFGEKLYTIVRQIKTWFDPYNQLNPGKIAIPLTSKESLVKVKGPLRGHFDKQITPTLQEEYASAMACNGNGACFNYATADIMCPSFKVTKDRIQSPKGRAVIIREWLRQLSIIFPSKIRSKKDDFSHEVFSALSGCLSCKACVTQCPLNVNIPEIKATFLFHYYKRYARSLRDVLIASLEYFTPWQAKFPRFTNWVSSNRLLWKWLRLIDLPKISECSIQAELKKRDKHIFNFSRFMNLSQEQKKKAIILLQDTFTSYYEPHILLKTYDFLTQLGFLVCVAKFFPSGKPLHVQGYLEQFKKLVKKNSAYLESLTELNIPLVGIDPSITLVYRDEYKKIVKDTTIKVQLIQEWLVQHLPAKRILQVKVPVFYLLSHCTEKALCAEAEKQWQKIFNYFGIQLVPLTAGCCGMAGAYGHEVEHVDYSRQLFKMDWQRLLSEHAGYVLATGYSCRSQVERILKTTLSHPIEVLATLIN